MRERDRRRQRGAAAIEFAIVLPVLIAILCGTIDWGYYFFTRAILVNASREGARVGTLKFSPPATAENEAEKAALKYLLSTSLARDAKVETGVTVDRGECPEESSCVLITYEIGGSLTGFLGSFVPDSIVAYAEMRK